MVPAKYHLTGKFDTAIQPMEQNKQTLIDPKIEVIDGQTVLSFTKLLVEEDEIPVVTGDNIFVWARGSDVDNTYHGENKGSFQLNLLKTGSSRSNDLSESMEVTNEAIKQPTNRPTVKPSIKPTAKPTLVSLRIRIQLVCLFVELLILISF
jgi:hypothetical protein